MKYTYKNKKTYKMKNKLKILLTILFAALITSTGYVISRNAFSSNDITYLNSTSTITVGTTSSYNIKNGINEGLLTLNKTGSTTTAHVVKVESGSKAKFKAITPGYYTSGSTAASRSAAIQNWTDSSWSTLGVTNMAREYESASDTSDVLVGINADFSLSGGNAPRGSLIMEGNPEIAHSNAVSDEFYFGYNASGALGITQRTSAEAALYTEGVCGGAHILRNGELYGVDNENVSRQRTGVCLKPNGETLLIAVESGITVKELAELMQASGCIDGINMDGGGSTTMITRRSGDTTTTRRTPELGNGYSDKDANGERMVTSALLLVDDDSTPVGPSGPITYTNTSTEGWGVTLQTDKSVYNRGEKIYVKTTGMSRAANQSPWIGIYDAVPTPTKDTQSKYWAWPWDGSNYVDVTDFVINNDDENQDPNMQVTRNRPLTGGNYWVAVFANDGKWAHVQITVNPRADGGTDEAYAAFDSSTGQLRIFRDTVGTYSDGQVVGNVTYYEAESSIRSEVPPWYDKNPNITSVVIEDEFRPFTAFKMFDGCTNLTSITGIENLNTEDVGNFNYMFHDCTKLQSIDVSGFDTSFAQYMWKMFSGCTRLTSLNLSNFDTSRVTTFGYMFEGCTGLTSLNISGFEGDSATSFEGMFQDCTHLTSIDTSFGTKSATTMRYMFFNCERLTSLDLSTFTTDKVTNLSFMFKDCTNLETVDLVNWQTKKVTNMSHMFTYCTNLATIYVDDLWSTVSVENSLEMFRGTRAIVGGKGTTYNLDYVEVERAKIDGGEDDPGYFTIGDYKNVSTESYGVVIKSNKSSYRRGEKIYVKTTGMSRAANQSPWIGIYDAVPTPTKDTTSRYWAWPWDGSHYVDVNDFIINNEAEDQDPNMVVTRNAPLTPGNYWIVIFANDGKWAHVPITVKAGLDGGNDEAFAAFDSSTGKMRIFRDEFDRYYNGQVEGNITYYKAEETVKGNPPPWIDINPQITKVTIEDEFRPYTAYKMFYGCENLRSITGIENLNTEEVANFNYMFHGCSSLRSLDVSGFDTSYAQYMWRMFSGCSLLTNLDVSGFNTSNVTNMGYMFADCTNLTTLDISSFDTSNVESLEGMFYNCSSLSEIDTSFRTDSATTMRYMFYGCSSVEELLLDDFDTSNVTNMSYMFQGCESLTNLAIDMFDTSKVVSMKNMFKSCSELTTLNTANFYTNNVTDMSGMFAGCSKLRAIDLSSFNTSKVTDMNSMFKSCSSITVLYLDTFDTARVTDMSSMFLSTTNLYLLGLGENFSFLTGNDLYHSWKRDGTNTVYTAAQLTANYDGATMAGLYRRTDQVPFAIIYDSGEMVFQRGDTPDSTKGNVVASYTGFDSTEYGDRRDAPWNSNASTITKITFETEIIPLSTSYWFSLMDDIEIENLEYLNTENVTKMNHTFYMSDFTSLDLSSFDTSNVTDMFCMFQWCGSLQNLDLSSFDTSNVTNMSSMFGRCGSLQNLDLSNFDTSNVVDMQYLFIGCSNLKNLDLSNFNTSNVTDMSYMFSHSSDLIKLDISSFDSSNVTTMDNMFVGLSNLASLTLGPDWSFLSSNGLTGSWKKDDVIYTAAQLTDSYDGSTMEGTYRRADQEVTAIAYDSGEMVFQLGATPDSTKGNVLGTYTGFENQKYVNSSSVPWNSQKSIITKITFNTEVKPISAMNWFSNMTNLTTIDDIEFLNTENVTSMEYMFYRCTSLTSLDLSSFDTSKVTDMNNMFRNCSSLTSLDVSGFDTSNVAYMGYMFYGCSNLTSLDLSSFDTSSLEYTYYMFYDCNELTTLDVSTFDTSKVIEMYFMFYGCSNLANIDVSSFNTSNVTQIGYMFAECSNLTSLDLSNFDTSKVEAMGGMFEGCTSLTSLDVSNFNTSMVTDMQSMFDNCCGLTSLDLSNFDTSRVEWLSSMFVGCGELTSLDLSNFDISKVKYSYSMFEGCSNLVTIYVSNGWNTGAIAYSDDMFKNCTSLVGGQGTTFNSSYTDKTRAIIDEGVSNPGYLTYKAHTFDYSIAYAVFDSSDGSLKFFRDDAAKYYDEQVIGTKTYYYNAEKIVAYDSGEGSYTSPWTSIADLVDVVEFEDVIAPINTAYWFYGFYNLGSMIDIENLNTSNVVNMESMFSDCNSLTSLDLSSFDTSSVTNMNSMFYNCNSLVSLDVSSFDTSNVQDIVSMFSECSSLTSLDVSSFYTSNVEFMDYLFYNCSSLTSLDLSNFDTSKIYYMESLFAGCSSLTTVDVSTFDTSNVESMYYVFYDCSSLTNLDISNFDTSNVLYMGNMFTGLTNLNVLKLGENFSFMPDAGLTGSWKRAGDTTVYTAADLMANYDGSTMAGTYRRPNAGVAYAEFDSSNGQLRIFRDTEDLYTNGQTIGTKTYYTGIEEVTGNSSPKWFAINYNIITVVIEDYFKPQTAAVMFDGCTDLISITGMENLDTSAVTNMEYMFATCDNLISIDLSNFDTSSVTKMEGMFYGSSLRRLDLSSFDTNNVTNMVDMFAQCTNLAYLDISSLSIPSGNAQSANMFDDTTALRILKLGVNNAFQGDENLAGSWKRDGNNTVYAATDLLDNYNGSTMAGIYQRIELTPYAIVYEDGDMVFQAGNTPDPNKGNVLGIYTGFETGTYTDETIPWASVRESITGVYFDTTIMPISTAYWFYGMEELSGIDYMDYLYTGDVTDMSDMFTYCYRLTYIDVSNFDTSNVIDMSYMFRDCQGLINLDLSSFDTSNVVNMEQMLGGCFSLTSLDISGFDTSNVTDMEWMFWGCNSLTNLDLSSFDTSKVTNMEGMFFGLLNVTALDLTSFDTCNVTNMLSMFDSCYRLQSIDVSNFDTSKVEDMSMMFRDCASLTSLDVSNFDTANVAGMSNMFDNCNKLTTIDLSNFDTSNVDSMGGMFQNCSSLTSLDVNNFDTSNVVSMAYMFNNCRSLTELDISNFDTSSLSMDYSYSIKDMFAYMLSLNTLKLGTEWEFLPSNGLTKSWIRDGDTTVYTAAQLTSSYDGSTMAGTYRAMVQLTITEEVRGSLADINKNFSFTINVIKNGHGINSNQSYSGTRSGSLNFNNGYATFSLKHGENIVIVLPCDVTYTITQDSDGYTLNKINDTGTLNDNATSEFIDILNGTTPTGIFIDLIPYIIMLLAGIGSIIWIKKFKYI